MKIFRLIICLLVSVSLLGGCSTTGGMYKKDDPQNGEFSIVNTIVTTAAVVGAILLLANSDGGGGGGVTYARDYQPGNNQWVCRNKANGEYADAAHCEGLPFVDAWP